MNETNFVYEYSAMLNERQLPVLKETAFYDAGNYADLNSPEKIAEFFNKNFKMENRGEEYVYMVAFDSKYHVLGIFEISHGTVDASLLGTRELFLRLLLIGAVHFAMIHNHPSGNPAPSRDDTLIAGKIKAASEIMNITFSDNIIIGRGNYFSFKEERLI